MSRTAVFSETSYRLLEVIPGLDGGSYVLCESKSGQRFICPPNRWERCDFYEEAIFYGDFNRILEKYSVIY